MRILLTGGSGFVGRVLTATLAGGGHTVRLALRTDNATPAGDLPRVIVGEIGSRTDWHAALSGVDAVVHAAGRAHVGATDDAERLMEVNARGTDCLARAAVRAGVRRFIFVSSVKVNGEGLAEHAYSRDDAPAPGDDYARSKLQGELALARAAVGSAMEAIIVRPPLVYGPEVRANFLRLLVWVHRGWPLPLGAVRNRRSLVSVWNLCDLLRTLIEHPHARGTWMVSDGEDLSTPELLGALGEAMGRRPRLLPVPPWMLDAAGTALGQRGQIRRLCGSLVVDSAATRSALGWSAPVPVREGLRRTVEWYLQADR